MHTLSRVSPRSAGAGYVCSACSQQLRRLWQPPKGKDQRSKYAAKVREAETEWFQKAADIRAGNKPSMLSILESRGFVNVIAGDRQDLDSLLTDKRIAAYVGVDPTAPSMHLGNLVPIMALYWMYLEGYQAITVLGGATVKIGDPTDRLTTRDMPASVVRKANMASMHVQIKKLWENMEIYANSRWGWRKEWANTRGMVNNSDWMNKTNLIEFLRTLGVGTRVGPMLGRDTARNKMEKGDGLSFAELSYPLLQGWDWWQLFQSRGVQLQIGGADQFGNIIAGMDAVTHLAKNHSEGLPEVIKTMKPYGFTVPLLTTAKGVKFGKSVGNAIWIDSTMTSSWDLYQYFFRSADDDVEKLLKLFTLYPLPEISRIMAEHNENRSLRVAQRALAKEVVFMLHGYQAIKQVENDLGILTSKTSGSQKSIVNTKFPNDISPELNPNAPQVNAQNAPGHNIRLPRSLVENQPMSRVLYHAGMVSSRSEGNRLISGGGAHIGSKPSHVGGMSDSIQYTRIGNWEAKETWKYVMEDSLMILRAGKWRVRIVQILPDGEFDRLGLDAPGWKEFKDPESHRQATQAPAKARQLQ